MNKQTAISKILNYISIQSFGELPTEINGLENDQLLMLLTELAKNQVIRQCKVTTSTGCKTVIKDGYSVDKDLAEKIYGLKWPY